MLPLLLIELALLLELLLLPLLKTVVMDKVVASSLRFPLFRLNISRRFSIVKRAAGCEAVRCSAWCCCCLPGCDGACFGKWYGNCGCCCC